MAINDTRHVGCVHAAPFPKVSTALCTLLTERYTPRNVRYPPYPTCRLTSLSASSNGTGAKSHSLAVAATPAPLWLVTGVLAAAVVACVPPSSALRGRAAAGHAAACWQSESPSQD